MHTHTHTGRHAHTHAHTGGTQNRPYTSASTVSLPWRGVSSLSPANSTRILPHCPRHSRVSLQNTACSPPVSAPAYSSATALAVSARGESVGSQSRRCHVDSATARVEGSSRKQGGCARHTRQHRATKKESTRTNNNKKNTEKKERGQKGGGKWGRTSDWAPTARTRNLPLPSVTLVPDKRKGLSALFFTASDSPVSADSSIRRSFPDTSTPSPGTFAPVGRRRIQMSPGDRA
eukprot:1983390-Rhodomonas_salina.2